MLGSAMRCLVGVCRFSDRKDRRFFSFSCVFWLCWLDSEAMIVLRADVVPGVNLRTEKAWSSHIRVLDWEQKSAECDLFRKDFVTEDWMEPGEASLRSAAKARIERVMDCCVGGVVQVRYFFGGQSLLVKCGVEESGRWCLEGEEDLPHRFFPPETIWKPIRDVVRKAFGFRKPSSPPPWVAKRLASAKASGDAP